MEILKDLHTSIVEVCEVSFQKAHQELESQLAAQVVRVKEAERNASVALEAQQAAEQRVEELQREVSALRDELSTYNVDPKELEQLTEISNLEREFAPKHIWRADLLETDQLREILEDKYTTLYTDLQAFSRSWVGLKSKLLQHKKKLQLWDKQLKGDSFTILLDKAPVTFRRVLDKDASTARHHRKSQTPIIRGQSHSIPEDSQSQEPVASIGTPTPSVESRTDANPRIKIEESSQGKPAPNQHVAPATQATSASGDTLSSESSSDVLYPLPNIQTKKRKRVLPSDQGELQQGAPERPVLIKAETMSSSPIHQAAPGSGPHFPSTQDLDEIPGTVPTPTKRRAHREIHWEDKDEGSAPGTQTSILDQETQHHAVLQLVDGNARTGSSLRKAIGYEKPRISSNRALLMAEDGDCGDSQDHSRKRRAQSTAAIQKDTEAEADGKVTRDRLQGLLEGSLPPKSPLCSLRQVSGRVQSESGNPNLRQQSRPAKSASPRPVDQPSQTGPEVRPEEEPYRSRPLHRLNLDHFKINPARNQGLDYAYDTVVRKKDDRKCMSGCTRPGCCGDRFRAMARMGVQGTNTSAEQKEEDQRILEEYVGEDRHLLDGLSDKDRETLLVEARARDLANQYGRHRHTHQRARSPPGFWRTEMPSTQEIEIDREAARKMEREKVKERYREAMRPGGLWTWADE